MDRDTVTEESPEINIKIFNKGSENDSYYISQYESNDLQMHVSDTILKPNCSESYKLTASRRNKEPHQIVVTINSQTNPDLVRKKVIWYR